MMKKRVAASAICCSLLCVAADSAADRAGMKDVAATRPAATRLAAASRHHVSYTLAAGSENWPADKRAAIVDAMDRAVALYNEVGEFDKRVFVSYNPGTPTADANYNGNIRFGGQIGYRTALHELGHCMGVGQHPNWRRLLVDGVWTGPKAVALARAFDGPDTVLKGDRQHFWPYGLNFDKESSPTNDLRHVLMVAALRDDMGIVNGK